MYCATRSPTRTWTCWSSQKRGTKDLSRRRWRDPRPPTGYKCVDAARSISADAAIHDVNFQNHGGLAIVYRDTVVFHRWSFPVFSARAWNSLPSSVRNAPSLTTFRRELKTTFSVVVRQWLGDRDCVAQYNCCLPVTTDCRRFCCFVFLFFSFFLSFFLILYDAPAMSLTW